MGVGRDVKSEPGGVPLWVGLGDGKVQTRRRGGSAESAWQRTGTKEANFRHPRETSTSAANQIRHPPGFFILQGRETGSVPHPKIAEVNKATHRTNGPPPLPPLQCWGPGGIGKNFSTLSRGGGGAYGYVSNLP